jgi:hypothetical protein
VIVLWCVQYLSHFLSSQSKLLKKSAMKNRRCCYLFSLDKIIMKKNSNKTEKLPQITAEEVQALVAALKKSGTKAGTGDQIKEVRKSR